MDVILIVWNNSPTIYTDINHISIPVFFGGIADLSLCFFEMNTPTPTKSHIVVAKILSQITLADLFRGSLTEDGCNVRHTPIIGFGQWADIFLSFAQLIVASPYTFWQTKPPDQRC